jgi:hypothetical protein
MNDSMWNLRNIISKPVLILVTLGATGFMSVAQAQYKPNSAWPNGYVPFEFASTVTQEQRELMLETMELLTESGANINFVYRTGNQTPFLLIRGSDVMGSLGSATTGRRVSSENVLTINNDGGWTATWVIVHEWMHVLGFVHEHARPDRDTYVTINYGNITPGQSGNFSRAADAEIVTPYDYTSIMHYDGCNDTTCSSCSLNTPECFAITTVDPDAQSVIGLLDEWGVYDRQKLMNIYGTGLCAYADSSAGSGGEGSLIAPFANLFSAAALAEGGYVWCRRGSEFDVPRFFNMRGIYGAHGNGAPVILR